jgi:hypothetical protein
MAVNERDDRKGSVERGRGQPGQTVESVEPLVVFAVEDGEALEFENPLSSMEIGSVDIVYPGLGRVRPEREPTH